MAERSKEAHPFSPYVDENFSLVPSLDPNSSALVVSTGKEMYVLAYG